MSRFPPRKDVTTDYGFPCDSESWFDHGKTVGWNECLDAIAAMTTPTQPELLALAKRVRSLALAWGEMESNEERDRIAADLEALAAQRVEAECDGPCVENDGCPTELAVLQRYWRAHPPQAQAGAGDADTVWLVAKALWNSQKNSVLRPGQDSAAAWEKRKASYYIDAQCVLAALEAKP